MPSARRTFLGSVGTALAVGIWGCTGSERRPVSNPTAESRSLFVEILPADVETDFSENGLFAEWIDLAPDGADAASYVERRDAFDAQKALVRVKNGRGYIVEYTFVPDCLDSETGEHVEVTVLGADAATVSQSWCRT